MSKTVPRSNLFTTYVVALDTVTTPDPDAAHVQSLIREQINFLHKAGGPSVELTPETAALFAATKVVMVEGRYIPSPEWTCPKCAKTTPDPSPLQALTCQHCGQTRVGLKLWEIWHEGYRANGDFANASLLVRNLPAETFAKACEVFFKYDTYFDPSDLTHWRCGLFDNEQDARKKWGW